MGLYHRAHRHQLRDVHESGLGSRATHVLCRLLIDLQLCRFALRVRLSASAAADVANHSSWSDWTGSAEGDSFTLTCGAHHLAARTHSGLTSDNTRGSAMFIVTAATYISVIAQQIQPMFQGVQPGWFIRAMDSSDEVLSVLERSPFFLA